MMKQDSNPTTSISHPTLATVCGQCGVEERKLLHNVRLRGTFRRLCTSCVLRLHPQCFCPYCLGVYDRLPPDDAVVCYKCYSSSHPTCVSPPPPPAGTMASRGPSPCLSCLNPNLLVLNLNRLEDGRINNGTGRVIDNNAARLLLAAGKIASMSMNKAEVAAAMEAERRAKEAAYTKKRAREALDHVVKLMGKEKRVLIEGKTKRKVSVSNAAADGVTVNNNNKVDDASSEVLEALNAVELKDQLLPVQGVVVMEVDDAVTVSGTGTGTGKDSGATDNGSVKKVMEVDDAVTVSGTGKDSEATDNGSVKNEDVVKIVQIDQELKEKA